MDEIEFLFIKWWWILILKFYLVFVSEKKCWYKLIVRAQLSFVFSLVRYTLNTAILCIYLCQTNDLFGLLCNTLHTLTPTQSEYQIRSSLLYWYHIELGQSFLRDFHTKSAIWFDFFFHFLKQFIHFVYADDEINIVLHWFFIQMK